MDDDLVVLKRKLDERPDDEGLQIRYNAALDRVDHKVRKLDKDGDWIAWTPHGGVLGRVYDSYKVQLTSSDLIEWSQYGSGRLDTHDIAAVLPDLLNREWSDAYGERTTDAIHFDGHVSLAQAEAWTQAEGYKHADTKDLLMVGSQHDIDICNMDRLFALGSIRQDTYPKTDDEGQMVYDGRDVVHVRGPRLIVLSFESIPLFDAPVHILVTPVPQQLTPRMCLCVYRTEH